MQRIPFNEFDDGGPSMNTVDADAAFRAFREDLAKSLFGAYLLPFEVASILLLVAMVGAVVMAKKRTDAP